MGPAPEAIEVMGDKTTSRRTAEQAGVPSVPGRSEVLNSPQEVVAFGDEHGWPTAIKATHGGGGRGMRIVPGPAEAAAALESARSEAASAFGRPECYVELYLVRPRHVEMQVVADNQGNTVWLGERDCSCQRRHQKLLEESPAPGFPEDARQAMAEAAVKVARACGYVNAGTVEFLCDEGRFWFLEMNTRLQVEHPVTEMVTGIDLVELQLRIASGERLPWSQGDIDRRGHSIECRVNAEDPTDGGFVPSPGTIDRFKLAGGLGVRCDAGYEAGDVVSPAYDSLLAKVVTWGEDRDVARRRMLRALEEVEVDGVATTIPAQQAILRHPDFVDGDYFTTWVEDCVDLSQVGAARPPSVAEAGTGQEGRVRRDVDVEVDGRLHQVRLWLPETAPSTGGGAAAPARRRSHAGSGGAGARAGTITVPMQGTILKVLVVPGDTVELGQSVCVLEAMKMESNVNADKAGTVSQVRVGPGDTVSAGDVVVVIE